MMPSITNSNEEMTTVKGALERELARQAQVGAALRAQKAVKGKLQVLRVNQNHDDLDEGAAAMTAHSLLPVGVRDDMVQRRIRQAQWNAFEEAKTKQLSVNGTDEVALSMEPPSLVAHLRRAR
jgi:hypothetical protein